MSQDAADELARALRGQLAGFAGTVTIEELTSRRWASITFTGARHRLALRLDGAGARAAAEALLDGIEEREFALRGHIVADIALKGAVEAQGGDKAALTLEALTVEAD